MSEYFRKYIKKEHYPNHYQNIKFKTTFRNCVVDSLKKRGWKEVEGEDWDLLWVERDAIYEILNHFHLQPHQRVNHFRNHYELTRKDLMIKNLKRYKKQLDKEGKFEEAAAYNFYPTTYNLPGDYSLFVEEFKKSMGSVWIMKPIAKSQGKGIFLFNKLQQIAQWKNDFRWKPESPQAEPYIVQKYIINPLLIGGKKFDMRIYCLVTSYSPLTAYLYRTGFARFTHHRYNTNLEDIQNNYVHLTNVAIQKTSENYDDRIGGKWDLRGLKLYLMSKYGAEAVSEAFSQIQEMIVRCLQSVAKTIINDKHCFELYGFDVLLDSNLKPWLIEINASPSMTANTPHDYEMKIGLLDDTFTVLDLEKIMTGTEEQIGGFDLIVRGNPVKLPNNSTYMTHLGCQNNRQQQLKKLAKSTAARLVQHYAQEQLQTVGTGPGITSAGAQPKNNSVAMKRIQKEQKDMIQNPSPYFYAEPLENEPFEWHFTIRGPEETEFEGGFYHGVITLPSSYPFKPPYIIFLTPSGRFQVKEKICMTFTNYHPEYWQPAWTIRNILQGLVSFMPVDEDNLSVGAIQGSKEERKKLAKKSQDFVCENCGKIQTIVKNSMPQLTEEAKKEYKKEESIFKFAPQKQLIKENQDQVIKEAKESVKDEYIHQKELQRQSSQSKLEVQKRKEEEEVKKKDEESTKEKIEKVLNQTQSKAQENYSEKIKRMREQGLKNYKQKLLLQLEQDCRRKLLLVNILTVIFLSLALYGYYKEVQIDFRVFDLFK